MKRERLIIYDLKIKKESDETTACFYADSRTVRCKGCFGCWMKTPGECVMHDGSEHIGSLMAQSKEVWIYSRILYGGFSMEVKRVLDRCIPGVLPFFTWRKQRMHHVPRYLIQPRFHIVFYDSASVSSQEKELAKRAAEAMSVNMNASAYEVTFLDGMPEERRIGR